MKRRSNRIESKPSAEAEKPYGCPSCEKSFKRIDTVKEHERNKHGDSWYACSCCNLEFGYLHLLKAHERSAHGDNVVTCKTCSKKFSTVNHLQRHEAVHTNERPHECSICSKTFQRADHLKVHEQNIHNKHGGPAASPKLQEEDDVHIGRKCMFCLNQFNSTSDTTINKTLHRHQIVLSFYGDASHQCTVCLKTLRRCLDNSMHQRDAHSATDVPVEKGHQCKKCLRLFGTKKALKKIVPTTDAS